MTTRGSPLGWNLVREDTIVNSLRQAIYVKVAGGSEPASYTWTLSKSRRIAGGITAYAGVDTATPVDVHGARVNANPTAVVTAPSVTTTVAGTLAVHFAAVRAEGTISPPAGMTERWEAAAWKANSSRDATAAAADAPQAAAGPTGPRSATVTQAGRSIGAVLALRPAGTSPAEPGVVFRYDMTGITGSTLPDVSGHNLNGTLINFASPPATEPGPGATGTALRFVRTEAQRVFVGDTQAALDVSRFTIMAWVRITEADTPEKNWEVMEKAGAYWLNIRNSAQGHVLRAGVNTVRGANPNQLNSPFAFPRDGSWHHVACSFDGTTQRLYYDGNLVARAPTSGSRLTRNDKKLIVGAKEDPGASPPVGNYWQGAMTDVSLYDIALSDNQIAGAARVGGAA